MTWYGLPIRSDELLLKLLIMSGKGAKMSTISDKGAKLRTMSDEVEKPTNQV